MNTQSRITKPVNLAQSSPIVRAHSQCQVSRFTTHIDGRKVIAGPFNSNEVALAEKMCVPIRQSIVVHQGMRWIVKNALSMA